MRSHTQKQPQVKKELCRVLDDVDVDGKPPHAGHGLFEGQGTFCLIR